MEEVKWPCAYGYFKDDKGDCLNNRLKIMFLIDKNGKCKLKPFAKTDIEIHCRAETRGFI